VSILNIWLICVSNTDTHDIIKMIYSLVTSVDLSSTEQELIILLSSSPWDDHG
jgi:hypothetical protein